ncbi:hypothetical protein E2H86_23450 [Pseudomonas putida]|uniref:hypothetical protein n=1 Tax=Pseudomonas TaxID=286 RepID=UPI001059CC6C|nr:MULTISPECIES: hypothetical protein [Pseudomonas]MBF8744959.1 hypothetical protein [Pseudomonas monteilii]MCT8165806.1 hypothetical protein [Pseudomonas sp. HD6422]MCT8184789.1 hypothetical protein [Pseudomonas sp. HD6421]TDJ73471.1 hypothetical protein E2H86_23450 [Pseudomonas putida]
MLNQIHLTIDSRKGMQPGRLEVRRQVWWHDGFHIEAEGMGYWMRLTGQQGPEPGFYILESDDAWDGRVQVEFGLHDQQSVPIEEGDFLLTNINYRFHWLAGEFSFRCTRNAQSVTVNCLGFETDETA